jgi:hypothetical protein
MKQYYYQDAGNVRGPYTKEEIIAKGLRAGTYVWYPGLEVWVRIEAIPELATPTPKAIHSQTSKAPKNLPSKKTFAIISICIITVLLFIGNKGNEKKIRNEIREMSYIDPSVDFSMYVDKFYRDLEVYRIRAVKPENIIIKFSKLETTEKYKDYNAVALGYNNDDIIEIYINPYSWKQSSKARRYWLMYHELAHDVLNAEHVTAIPANEGKLMYPYSTNFEITDMDEFIEAFHAFFGEYSNR